MSSSPSWLNNHARWRMSLNDQAGSSSAAANHRAGGRRRLPLCV